MPKLGKEGHGPAAKGLQKVRDFKIAPADIPVYAFLNKASDTVCYSYLGFHFRQVQVTFQASLYIVTLD